MLDVMNKFFSFCSVENRKKFHKSIFLGVFASLFNALKIPAIGLVLMNILSGTLTGKVIWGAFGLMLLSVIGTSTIKYFSVILQTEAGYGEAAMKRIQIAEHMRYMPMGYFNENSLGRITSTTTNTMENLADVGTRVVLIVSEGILTTLVITLFVFLFDWRIGLMIMIGLVFFALANSLLQKKAEEESVIKTESDAELVDRVIEYIKGIAEVKAYHLSGRYARKLETAVDANVKANQNLEVKLLPFMLLQSYIAKVIGVLIAMVSIYFFCNGSMSLLNSIMMIICSFMILESLEMAGNFSALMRIVDLCIDKAEAILNVPVMDIDGEDITPKTHDIEAEGISFAYSDRTIIDNVDVHIPEKTTTAIVGPSGGGKTTLCHLLSRFWDPDAGRVTLDGRDIREYSMDSLMKNFSFVFQNVYLFKDTIANNIRFGEPEASMEKVMEAARKARCHEFIMKLPDGYETVIGEDGGTLSGGERQRLSIARAIMKDSPVIILDEATANVDPENEKDLMEAISELTKDKTIIMIAHRLKTVRNADQILVVDNGKIVQKGNHESLMEKEGIYRRFVDSRKIATSWKIQ